eukprot:TRINITY_DN1575_c0_g1_i1.p1 TRINITY_DN1575_c0_g1~~TRINITY_DN1575_c0_g1_i1.p1  ORF type:complete len:175 (+),score=28.13 TRINITY_DN1575_c0_g1_i1:332-856(+)
MVPVSFFYVFNLTFFGTLMCYPIIHFLDNQIRLREYFDYLEDIMIHVASIFGLECIGRIEGKRGIWTKSTKGTPDKKVGSVGISVRHWVAAHGFALNVTTDLSYFDHIVACGLENAKATSIEAEAKERGLQEQVTMERAVQGVSETFCRKFHKVQVTEETMTTEQLANYVSSFE